MSEETLTVENPYGLQALWAQGDFIARSVGMPDVPRVCFPHPVAGSGTANMVRVAGLIRDDILAALRGGRG